MKKVLVANRGEIAVRIIKALREAGLAAVAVYSSADAQALHVQLAEEAVFIGEALPAASYLNGPLIVEKAKALGADAIHPGYGFLSESAEFSAACAEEGLTFIGPGAEVCRRVADKVRMKETVRGLGIPIPEGSEPVLQEEDAARAAERIGYPVMLKAASGGGGRGIRILNGPDELSYAFQSAFRESAGAFGAGDMFVERHIALPRHVEVQILADNHGNVIHLHDRECSLQRRFQKIVEEAPAPSLPPGTRTAIQEAAVSIMQAVGYRGAGTVEFLVDGEGRHFFLEVNPRIQVEHPVTEMITGVDIVKWQCRIAQGDTLDLSDVSLRGAAIECRICAEDPARDFRPSPGRILHLDKPTGPGLRVDSGICEGFLVPREYDALLAKVVAYGSDRQEARRRMAGALRRFRIAGVTTTTEFLLAVMEDEEYARGPVDTGFLSRRFADWQPSGAMVWEALAAAAVIEEEEGQVAEKINGGNGSALSPWRRLGKWRLGRGD